MMRSDLLRAVLLLTIPAAAIGGWLTLPQLLLVTFVGAILSTFFDAADNAYLPTIVGREKLVRANGALAASGSAAELTAFGISSFLVQLFSAPIAILVDAVSFVDVGGVPRQAAAPGHRHAARSPIANRSCARCTMASDASPRPRAARVRSGLDGDGFAVGSVRASAPVHRRARIGGGGDRRHRRSSVASKLWSARRSPSAPPDGSASGTAAIASMMEIASSRVRPRPPGAAGLPVVAFAFLVGQQLIGDGAVHALPRDRDVRPPGARPGPGAGPRHPATLQVASVGAQLAAR